MLALARDLDPVPAAACEDLRQGVVWIERGAILVEFGHFDIGAKPHAPFVGGKRARQQFDQGRLARAVRADEAQSVAAQHAQRQIADDRPIAKGLRQAFGLDDETSGQKRCVDCEFDVAMRRILRLRRPLTP